MVPYIIGKLNDLYLTLFMSDPTVGDTEFREDTLEVRANDAASVAPLRDTRPVTRPLAGITVVDLTHAL